MAKKIKHLLPALGLSIVLSGIMLALFWFNLLEGAERRLFDLRLKARGQLPQSDNIAIAVIDNESVSPDQLGRWPWPRAYQAFLVEALNEYGASVIGFDIFFPEPDENVPLWGIRSFLLAGFESLGLNSPSGGKNLLKNLNIFYKKWLGADFIYAPQEDSKKEEDEVDKNLNPDKMFAERLAEYDNVILGYYFTLPMDPEKVRDDLGTLYKALKEQFKNEKVSVPEKVKSDYKKLVSFLKEMEEFEEENIAYSYRLQVTEDFVKEFNKSKEYVLGLQNYSPDIQNALKFFYSHIESNLEQFRKELTLQLETPNEEIKNFIKENIAGMESSTIPYESPPNAINSFIRAPSLTPNIPLFTSNTKHFGHVSVKPDPDGVIRYNMAGISIGDYIFPSLSLKSAALYKKQPLKAILQPAGLPPKLYLGDSEIPLDEKGRILINYHGGKKYPEYNIFYIIRPWVIQEPKEESIPAYFAEVMKKSPEEYFMEKYRRAPDKGEIEEMIYNEKLEDVPIASHIVAWESEKLFKETYGKTPKEAFHDKIVLVGATATGVYDMRVTPFSEDYPGVEIHAQVIDSILKNKFLFRPTFAPIYGLTLIISLALILGVVIPLISAVRGAVLVILLFLGLASLDFFFFFRIKGWWMPFVYPALQMGAVYFAVTIYRYATEEREKRFIKDTFGRYLAPSVVEVLTKNPEMVKLGGQKLEMTAFFSDIRGFSTISETLGDPQLLVELLNDYLSAMAHVIEKYEGTIDKYEGDAIIAFWGAPVHFPDHAVKACFACLDQQIKLAELRAKWKNEGKWPPIVYDARVRMGLNTGEMVVGNMGSAGRMNYTIMGDAVNLASRLEGANKPYGTYIMISEFTYRQAKDFIEVRELDSLRVVGKTEPVKVYELLARKGELPAQKLRVVEIFHEGLEAYKQQKWDIAIARFTEALNIDPNDGPSKTYIARCEEFKVSPPPADWDGVYTLESK